MGRPQPGSRQHAEQAGDDGRERAEDAFVVPRPLVDSAREVVEVQPVGEVEVRQVYARAGARHRHERHHRPVAEQDARRQPHKSSRVEVQVDQRRRKVANRDALEDARNPQVYRTVEGTEVHSASDPTCSGPGRYPWAQDGT